MKTLNRSSVVIICFVVLFTLNGLGVCAEPADQTTDKPSSGSIGWSLLKEEKGFHLNFDGSVSYGPISGYLQTPLGGAPLSASEKRPTFKELGINNVTVFNLSLSASINQHSLFGAAHLANPDGEKTLDESFVFHGVDYPAGTEVKSEVRLNWYELGYKYDLQFGRDRVNLRIAPIVSVALFDYNASLESGGIKNTRSYVKGTPRVGLELEWFPWKRFSIYGQGIGSLPFNNTPGIYTFGLTGKYLIVNQGRWKISLFAGLEYDLIDYKDSQTTPNHVRAEMGPLGTVGIEMRF